MKGECAMNRMYLGGGKNLFPEHNPSPFSDLAGCLGFCIVSLLMLAGFRGCVDMMNESTNTRPYESTIVERNAPDYGSDSKNVTGH